MAHVWGTPETLGQIHCSTKIDGQRAVGFTYERAPYDWTWRVELYGTPAMHLRPGPSAGPWPTRLAAFAHLEDTWSALVGGADPATLGVYQRMA